MRGGGAFRPWPPRLQTTGSNSPEPIPGPSSSAELVLLRPVLRAEQASPRLPSFAAFPALPIPESRQASRMPGRDSQRALNQLLASRLPCRRGGINPTERPFLRPVLAGKSQYDACMKYRSRVRRSTIVFLSGTVLELTTYGVLAPPSGAGSEHCLTTRAFHPWHLRLSMPSPVRPPPRARRLAGKEPATTKSCRWTTRQQKKAPGKVVSQGGRGHDTFPGAIGRCARWRSAAGMSEARGLHPCKRRTLRGPQESPCETSQCRPIHVDWFFTGSRTALCRRPCRQMKHS